MPQDVKTLRPIGHAEPEPQQGRRYKRNKFYNTSLWRKTSKAYRALHPLCECEKCSQSKYPLPGDHCDHIEPINPVNAFDTMNGQYGEPLDESNLQSLNIKCHARKSAKERHEV